MTTLATHTHNLLRSLMVSHDLVVGGKKDADKELYELLVQVAEFEPGDDKSTIPKIPFPLLTQAQVELKEHLPSAEQIKNWLLYELDLSGTAYYQGSDGKATFGRIVRSLDLSNGSQYYDNRPEAAAYTDARQSGDEDKIKCAGDILKARLPGKKLRFLHWIGPKPDKDLVEQFKAEHPEYFSNDKAEKHDIGEAVETESV